MSEVYSNAYKIMIIGIYLAFNNTLLITVCKAPFHYPTNGLNRSRYSNRALGKLPYDGLFLNEFYFRIIRRGSLLRKFNSSNNKKPTINSNRIVRSRATTRECGCHRIASLFQDFQQTSRIAMALY